MPKRMLAVAATKIRRRSNFPQASHSIVSEPGRIQTAHSLQAVSTIETRDKVSFCCVCEKTEVEFGSPAGRAGFGPSLPQESTADSWSMGCRIRYAEKIRRLSGSRSQRVVKAHAGVPISAAARSDPTQRHFRRCCGQRFLCDLKFQLGEMRARAEWKNVTESRMAHHLAFCVRRSFDAAGPFDDPAENFFLDTLDKHEGQIQSFILNYYNVLREWRSAQPRFSLLAQGESVMPVDSNQYFCMLSDLSYQSFLNFARRMRREFGVEIADLLPFQGNWRKKHDEFENAVGVDGHCRSNDGSGTDIARTL